MKVVSRQLESSKLCAGTVYPQGRQTSLLGAAFIPLRTFLEHSMKDNPQSERGKTMNIVSFSGGNRILWRRTARPYYCYTCLLSWFEWAETKVNKCRRCGSRDIKAGRQRETGSTILINRSRDARRRIVDANYVGTNCNTPRPLKRADPVLDWRSKYRAGDGGGQLLNKRG